MKTTSYEVKIEYGDHTHEVLTIIGAREYGARGHNGKPESVELRCRPPMLRAKPIDMILFCPACGMQHIDAPESENTYTGRLHESSWWELGGDKPERWTNPPHRSHLCSKCGHQWRPADVATNGVAEIQTRGKNDNPTIRGTRHGDTMPQPWHERPEHGDTPRRRRILEREKAEAGGMVLNTDGLPRLYSVTFRPEGGFLVDPVGQYVASVADEKAAAAAERIGDVLRRAPGEPAPDTEIDMARRQAARADETLRQNEPTRWRELRGSVTREPEWLERPERWTASFDLGERDKVLKRLRDLMAHVEVPQSRVLHDAITFLESLAP